MKNMYLKTALLFYAGIFMAALSNAQGIYQFWGNTLHGGASDRGVLFSTKYDGSGYAVRQEFSVLNPGHPTLFNAPVAHNAKLYSLLEKYNSFHFDNQYCVITAYDMVTGEYTQVADLTEMDGRVSAGKLILLDNKLYGATEKGGVHNKGLLFEYDLLTGTLTKKYDFDSATGSPREGITAYEGKVYGLTGSGGDFSNGTIYQYDPSSDNFMIRKHLPVFFSGSYAGLTAFESKLWGASNAGVFAFNPLTDVLTTYTSFMTIGLQNPYGQLAVLGGKLYGVTNEGGSSDEGGIYEFDPEAFSLQLEFAFNDTTAQSRCELTAYAGKLYSASYFGAIGDHGRIFSYEPVLNKYKNEIIFSSSNRFGSGSMHLLDGKLYGFTCDAGAYGEGTLYEYNPLTNLLDVKIHLGGNNIFHPIGKFISYDNKIYGLAFTSIDSSKSGIFEFDPVTGSCILKKEFTSSEGKLSANQEGLIFYNNKLYGVTAYGGANGKGTLFEYNPLSNTYTKKHDFDSATGEYPYAQLHVYSGKLYGTTYSGSSNDLGSIFEYNLLTNTYTQKVIFSTGFGWRNYEGLTLLEDKLYGTCLQGGDFGGGTLYEYDPEINSFAVKVHFDHGTTASMPNAKLVAYNGSLYGMTAVGGLNNNGALFEYNTITNTYYKRMDLDSITGSKARAGLIVMNDKLYGTTPFGGINMTTDSSGIPGAGILFEFNPISNKGTKKYDFSAENGYHPSSQLLSLPAFIAPGTPGTCHQAASITSTTSNAFDWLPLTDSLGNAVAEINPNGNVLGTIECDFYVHDGAIRSDASGNLYLDRNITITTEFTPVTPVSVRMYIKKDEFDVLNAHPESGIDNILDLQVFKNENDCQAAISDPALPVSSAITASNWSNGYVLSFQVDSFSTFYFASEAATVLPIELTSFTGKIESDHNLLQWEANIGGESNMFQLERSKDGKSFEKIYVANGYPDSQPLPYEFKDYNIWERSYYYRLRFKSGGVERYSNIVLLNRNSMNTASIRIYPNPVTANHTTMVINAADDDRLAYRITDITGRTLLAGTADILKGSNSVVLDLSSLPNGIYYLSCSGQTREYPTVKIVRQ